MQRVQNPDGEGWYGLVGQEKSTALSLLKMWKDYPGYKQEALIIYFHVGLRNKE